MKNNGNEYIIGWCVYCKNEIYLGEKFVKSDRNLYHASETEEHDNCWKLVNSEEK